MFKYKLYEYADLYGLIYTFPKRGDGIGMHTHERDQEHNIIVTKGSIQAYGPNRCWCVTLKPGDVFDLLPEVHYPHEVVALEDDSEIIGMFVYGKPEGEDLPAEERQGEMTLKPVTHEIIE